MSNLPEPRRRLFKAIFIDGSFLFHCVQQLSVRIDYKKLKNLFINPGDHLVSAAYYTALPNEYDLEDKHKAFLRILKKEVRVKVRSVPLLKAYDFNPQQTVQTPFQATGRYSKGEDILLACDLVRGAATNQFDECVLVTGDGDFTPAVECVQELGKSVIVASFYSSLSNSLELAASDVIYLDEHLDKLRLIAEDK